MHRGKSGERSVKFLPTSLSGAYVIEPELREDERGFFTRVLCVNEFSEHGLNTDWLQANMARSHAKGTTRGMHYQREPHAEAKLVRCTQGSVFDAIIDMRSNSATYQQWFGVELSASNLKMLYVPEGFAHGYQVLEENSEMHYMVSALYAPEAEDGVRWDDPKVAIDWPIKDSVQVSDKDQQWSLLV